MSGEGTGDFADRCWARAERGVGEEERERLEGPGLVAEVYRACDLTRLSFARADGRRLPWDPALDRALASLERAHGVAREVRTPPDSSGDFNLILNRREGGYVARLTPEKLLVEPGACGRELGGSLLELYGRLPV